MMLAHTHSRTSQHSGRLRPLLAPANRSNNPKVTNNLATYLCEDPTFTPQCSDKPQDVEAVTMEEMTYLPPEDDTILEGDVLNPHREARIGKRGASMALEEIACGSRSRRRVLQCFGAFGADATSRAAFGEVMY